MKGFLPRFAFGILIFLISGVASAAVYKCDAGGAIVYSAHPCGKDAVRLALKDQSYSAPTRFKHAATPAPEPTHSAPAKQRVCAVDTMNSVELRNMRVSHIIMVCESAAGVRATWGKPDSITRTVSKGHVREHWTYDGPRGKPVRSVNLEDGKVTSFKE